MRQIGALILLASVPMWTSPLLAQEPEQVVVTKVKGNVYELFCADAVSVVASVGPDGVLLVDTGFGRTADAVREALAALGGGEIRYIVNTHAHSDHVGGNAVLGANATIIAHENVRRRMSRYYALPPASDEGLPRITFTSALALHFNGERIDVFHLGASHTDGDVVVHFTESGVACVGDLVFSDTFTGADRRLGGEARLMAETFEKLVETLPDDVRMIPSHGRSYAMDDLRRHRDVIVATTTVVREGLEAGKSAEALLAEGALAEWDSWSGPRDRSLEAWVTQLAASLSGRPRESICAPLTEAIVSQGAEAAVKLYRELSADRADDYELGENELNSLGYELLARSMVSEATAIFELNVEAYPEAFNPYDSLGEAYMIYGDTERAIANYERSLELNPENTNAAAALRKLRAE